MPSANGQFLLGTRLLNDIVSTVGGGLDMTIRVAQVVRVPD